MKKILITSFCFFLSIGFLVAQAPRPFPIGLPQCLEDDFRELEKLYDATDGDNWIVKTGWFINKDMSQWKGITLTFDKCDVAQLRLNNNSLKGKLIDLKLPKLATLDFASNKISGKLIDFSNIPLLDNIHLENNDLEGVIPDFSNFPNLTSLYLSQNKMSGKIPDFSKMPKLRYIYLQENKLNGSIPNFSKIPLLYTLDLGTNRLSDTIPNFSVIPSVKYIYLNDNLLVGKIPVFNKIQALNLDFKNNKLSGKILKVGNINQNTPLENNLFNFGDLEEFVISTSSNTKYAPQKTTLPISKNGNIITGDSAGSKLSKLTFLWYRNGVFDAANIGQNTYTIQKGGSYHYEVRHATVTNKSYSGTNLILKSESVLIGSVLNGKFFVDQNKNCLLENSEIGWKNTIIRFENPKDTVYTTSDANGNYNVGLDTFSYTISLKVNDLWQSCNLPKVKFTDWNQSKTIDIPMLTVTDCPFMEVSLSTQRLRRCFDNNYYIVNYCNQGTIAAKNAYVEIDFDKYLQVISATKTYSKINGNKYRFEIGNVERNECADFNVRVKVDCDSTVLGQTHCTTAHIFPDSTCTAPIQQYAGANIRTEAQCTGGKVQLKIRNDDKNTVTPIDYFVIEDQIMIKSAAIGNLGTGQATTLEYPSNGKTYRIIATQAAFHPSRNQYVTSAVERCGGTVKSTGMIMQFADYDNEPFIDVDCQRNIGAYDPNEKIPSPLGIGTQKLIGANTEIEYQINFQNEGTDTAFVVVVKDTLDAKTLELNTLQMGVSSHPYKWELTNKGELKVTFDKINLTTKKENEALSQGFFRYRIAQRKDNPIGTVINNRAAIFFDFNVPIYTKTTLHRIAKPYSTVAVPDLYQKSDLKVTIQPNPFQFYTTFVIAQENDEQFMLQIFDLQGRLVHSQKFEDNQLILDKNMNAGLYFYYIKGSKNHENSGKIIVE